MAFDRPDLAVINERVKADIKAELGLTTILRRSFFSAFSKALAGAAHIVHGHLVFISKQIFPDQAEQEFADRWGSIFSVARKAATFTQLSIAVTFTDVATVAQGTVFQRSDGVEYGLDSEIISAGAETLTGIVTASESGAESNIDDGETISLVSPIGNVNSDSAILATLTQGEDKESDVSYNDRVVDKIQEPPDGGSPPFYLQTALSVAGVTRSWVTPGGLGEGTVILYFVEDGDDPVFPDAVKIAEVQGVIDAAKPIDADVTVVSPVANTLDLTIALKPNIVQVQNAIETELSDLVLREAQVAGSFEEVDSLFDGGLLISRINEAISIAEGEEDHVLISPTSDITSLTGELIVLGTITFQTLV